MHHRYVKNYLFQKCSKIIIGKQKGGGQVGQENLILTTLLKSPKLAQK